MFICDFFFQCKCGFAHLTGVDFSIDAFQLAQSVLHSGGFDDVHLEVSH